NPQQAVVYSANHEEIDRYYCPLQITGFEYQVQASIEAIRQGKIETSDMPHAETLRVMRLLDDLRYEWGVHFPADDR
ncbi:MAG: gfo/Idh/MocA family oxidoreductase, partial [Parabacteroides sp.]|nr:gfo/Idh/MocA family oxidoreductase [Parabacteroides sp.]